MFVGSSGPPMDIHRAHNHPSINSVAPGTRIEISIREASCSQSLRVRISAAERTGIGQPEVVDTLDAFPTALLLYRLLDGTAHRNFAGVITLVKKSFAEVEEASVVLKISVVKFTEISCNFHFAI